MSTRHQYVCFFVHNKSGSGARVTVYGMSGAEGQDPAGTDPIDLQLPRGAVGSSRMPTIEQKTPQSTAPVTRLIDMKSLLQVIPYHGEKASFLVGNGPSRPQCEQSANHSLKDSKKKKTT